MKSLLEHLNEVSKERGFRDFRGCTNDGRVYIVEDVIETAGKQYALEACKETLKNSRDGANTAIIKQRNMRYVYRDILNSIESETNIPQEVKL